VHPCHPCQLHLRCKFCDRLLLICRCNAHISFFLWWPKNQVKKIRSSLCDQCSLVGLRIQDYKSLCASVTICAALVNIRIHRHTDKQHFDQLILIAQPAELKHGTEICYMSSVINWLRFAPKLRGMANVLISGWVDID